MEGGDAVVLDALANRESTIVDIAVTLDGEDDDGE